MRRFLLLFMICHHAIASEDGDDDMGGMLRHCMEMSGDMGGDMDPCSCFANQNTTFLGPFPNGTTNAYFISWINNKPYYSDKKVKGFEGFGVTQSLIHLTLDEELNKEKVAVADCEGKEEPSKLIEFHNLPKHHYDTQQEIFNLLLETNKTRLLQKLNMSEDSGDIFIVSATTFDASKNGTLFIKVPVVKSEKSVLIVRTEDILLLLRFLEGISNCLGVVSFSITVAINLAAIIWFIERNSNPDFQNTFGAGLWTSFWYCFVTMTTVGYGDKVPKHFISRLLCLAWMLVGLMLTAIITTTVMEAVQKDYSTGGKDIGVLRHSTELSIVRSQLSGNPKQYNSYEEMYSALLNKDIDGILMDSNVASVYFNTEKPADLKIESEYMITAQIYAYIYYHKKYSWFDIEYDDDEIPVAMSRGMIARYVPPYVVVHYYTRSIEEMFNKQDGGLALYTAIAAGCLVFIGILSEIIVFIKGNSSSKMKRKRQETKKVLSYEMLPQYQKLQSLEKELHGVIATLKSEMRKAYMDESNGVNNKASEF
eukprot:TCONS_00057487-protein